MNLKPKEIFGIGRKYFKFCCAKFWLAHKTFLKVAVKKMPRLAYIGLAFIVAILVTLVLMQKINHEKAYAGTPCTWNNGNGTGIWNDAANWSCGNVPNATNDVILNSTSTANLNIDIVASVESFTIASNYTGEASQAASLTVSGAFSIAVGTFTTNGQAFTVGSYSQNGGTFNAGASTIVVSGNFSHTSGTYNAGSASITVSGDVTISGTFNATTSALTMDGTSKTLSANGRTLKDLTINGTITLSDQAYIGGTLTVNGSKILTLGASGIATMNAGSTTTITGTIKSSYTYGGRLELVDSAGANLSTGGTLSSVARFVSSTANTTVVERTFDGQVEFVNTSNTGYSTILGTAGLQTLNFKSNIRVRAEGSGVMTVDADTNDPTVNIEGRFFYDSVSPPSSMENTKLGSGTWTINGAMDLIGNNHTQYGTSTVIMKDSQDWGALSDGALGSATWTEVNALTEYGSELIVGGLGGESGTGNVARWKNTPDDTSRTWFSLGSGVNGRVRAAVVYGTDLIVAGDFTTAGGGGASHIAKWDGANWTALGAGVDDNVYALAVSGTDLIVGGAFHNAGGAGASHIASWDGANWGTLGSGTGDVVRSLATFSGNLYVGGDFTTAGGAGANYIASWNSPNWTALGSGTNAAVRALAEYGGKLAVGGDFTTAGGSGANYSATWDGANWATIGNGTSAAVKSLYAFENKLIAGGDFYQADSKNVNYVASWDGANWAAMRGGTSNSVTCLNSYGGELFAGGSFTRVGGIQTYEGTTTVSYIGKWGLADSRYADYFYNFTLQNTTAYTRGVEDAGHVVYNNTQVEANGNGDVILDMMYSLFWAKVGFDFTGVGAGTEIIKNKWGTTWFGNNVDLTGGTVQTGEGSEVLFTPSSVTQTIEVAGNSFHDTAFNGTGTAVMRPTSAMDVNGTFTFWDGELDLATNNPNINIAGNVRVVTGAGPVITKGTGLITFDGDLSYNDETAVANFGKIAIGVSPDTTNLSSNLICDSLTINAADTLNTNGYSIDCGGALTISATGTLNATGGGTISVGGNWSNSGTFTVSTSTVILDGTGAQSVTAGGTGVGKQFNNLTVTNAFVAGVTFNDSITVTATFTATTASTKMTFNATSTYTVTNISLNGQAAGTRVVMQSSAGGTDWLFNVTGTQSVSYVKPSDSDASGGSTINAANGTNDDAGGNHNWDFGVYRYWVSAGASTWNSAANWATASGGTGGASVPGASTPVIFDGGGTGDCGIDVAASVLTVEIKSGYSGTVTINATKSLTTSSSFSLADGTFDSNGQNLAIVSYSQTGGTFTAGASAITCTGAFAVTGGTYNANASTLTEDVTNAGATTSFDIRGFTLNNALFRSNSAAADKTVQFVGGLTTTDSFAGYVRLEAANTKNITLDGNNVDTVNVGGNFEFVGVGAGNEIFYPNSSRYWYFGGNFDIYNGQLNSTGSTTTYIFNSAVGQTLKQNNSDTGRFYSVQVENTSAAGLQILNTLNTDQIYLYVTGVSDVTLDATAVGAPDNLNIYGNIAGGGAGGGSKIIKAGSASWNVNYYNLSFATFTLQSGTSLFTFDTTVGFNGTINPGSNHFYDMYFKGDATKSWTLSGNLYASRNFTTEINFDVSATPNSLEIGGSFNSGNNHFVERNGTVTFDAIAGGNQITMQNDSFYNLVFNGVGGGWTLNAAAGNNLSVGHDLTVQNGTFDSVAGHTVTVSGTYSQSGGIFNTDASTVSLNTYAQTGGSFNANNATLSITGTYSQAVGTFNAPTSTLNLYDSFTRSSGAFNHNGGIVKFTVNKDMSISTANVSFNQLEITRTAGAVGHILTFQDGFTVEGNLTVKNEFSTSLDIYGSGLPTIKVDGSISFPATAQTGSLTYGSSGANNFTTEVKGNLSLDDSGARISSNISLKATAANQTIAINAGSVWASSWTVDNNGFSALMDTALNLQSSGNLTVTSGTLNMQNHDLTLVQAYSQGGGTFEGGSGTISIGNTFGLTNGTFNGGSGNMTVASAFSMSVGTVNAKSGNTSVSGAFTISSGNFVHSGGTVTLDGTVSRTLTTSGATFGNFDFSVNTNATTLADGFIVSLDLTHSGTGTINNPAVARTITLQGNFNKTGSGTLGGNNLTIDMTGNSKSFSTSLGAFGSILKLSGTSLSVSQSGGTFNTTSQVNVVGTASASTDLSLDLVLITSGTFDLLNRNLNVADDFTQNNGTFDAGSGTMTLGTATAFTLSNGTFNSPANLTATATTVGETFALSGGTFSAPSGTLTLKGYFTRNVANTFDNNGGLVKFITNASHDVTSANAAYNNVEFNRESGAVAHTVTLKDGFSVAGTLTAKNDYSTGLNIYATGTPAISVTGILDIPSTVATGTLAFGGTGVSIFTVNVAGNVSVADGNATVNANINLNNTLADQSISHTAGTIQTGTWTVTKGNYVANLATSLTLVSGGKLTLTTGVLYTAGHDLSVASTFSNNATLRVQGGETLIFTAGKDTDSGTVEYVGDGGATGYPSLNYGNSYYHLRFDSTSGTNSFSPNGAMTVGGNLTLDRGILDMAAQNMNLTGTFSNSATIRFVGSEVMGGAFSGDPDSGLTQYYGGGPYTNWAGGSQYFNLEFNSAGSFRAPATADVNGYFTLAGATLDLSTNSTHLSVAGNMTVNSGSVTPGAGQTHFDGDLTYDDNVGAVNFGNIVIGASPDTTNLSSDLVCASLTINAADILNTHGYDIDCADGITINGTGTLNATDDVEGDTTQINLGGNWSNSGSFTKDTSTVTLDGAGAQSVTAGGGGADKQFNNLIQTNSNVAGVTFTDTATVTGTWTNTTSNSHTTFNAGSTYAFTNINLAGTLGNLIILRSSAPTNQWFFNVAQLNPTANYVDVQDSDANGGSMIDARIGGVDSTNNENWLFAGNIIISGRIYTNEVKTGDIGPNKWVGLSVNGGAKTDVKSSAGGNFSFVNITVAANDTLTIFIDGEAEEANLISQTQDSSSNVSGLEMYTNKIVLRHESDGPMTNALLAIADNSGDLEIHYTVAGANVTFATGYEVWLDSSKGYTPAGQVTTDDLELRPTSSFVPAADSLTMHGSFKAASDSTFTTTGTTTFDGSSGTKTIESATKSFYNLAFNDGAGTATYRPVDNLDVNHFFTLTDGIFDLSTNNPNLNIAGNITINGGSVNAGSGTVRFDGDLTYTDNVGGTNFGRIEIGSSPDTTNLASNMACASLTVNAADVINTNGYDINSSGTISINSTGTLDATNGAGGDTIVNISGNWSNSGTFTSSTSTVDFNSGAGQTLNSGGAGAGKQFNHLIHSGAGTLQLSTNNITVLGNLTISAGTLDSNSLDITLYRNWTNGSNFTSGTGSVSFRGSSQSDITGTTSFYNLVIDTNSDGAKTVRFESAQTQTITNHLYLTGRAGKILTIQATIAGNQGRLTIPASMDICIDYLNVQDNRINGTNTIRTGNNSTDSGNNTNWLFGGGYDCFPPNDPTSLLQLKTDNTIIAAGGTTDETTVKFNGLASDNDPTDSLSLCIEVKLLGTAFINSEDNCGAAEAYTGTPVSIFATISSLVSGSDYHWQTRVKDATNQYSNWVAYGSGASADFSVALAPSPTPTPEPAPSPTPEPEPSPSATLTARPSATATESPILTLTPTIGLITPTPSPSVSPSPEGPPQWAKDIQDSPLNTLVLLGSLLAVVVPQALAAIVSALSLLRLLGSLIEKISYRLSNLWSLMPWYKKRPAWGVVYDGQTKKPIEGAAVRIYTVSDNRLRETQYTNKTGSFGFLVEAGQYSITVAKSGYKFPSEAVKGASDGIFQNLYHGGEIKVKENVVAGGQRAVISINIPLDRTSAVQTDVSLAVFLRGLSTFFNYIRLPMMILGTVLTVYLVITFGGALNYTFLVIYVLLWALEIYLALRPRTFGQVNDGQQRPLELVLVRAIDAEGRVSGSVVTGGDGRFRLNLDPGLYRFVAARVGYKSAQTRLMQIRRAADLGQVNLEMEQIGLAGSDISESPS